MPVLAKPKILVGNYWGNLLSITKTSVFISVIFERQKCSLFRCILLHLGDGEGKGDEQAMVVKVQFSSYKLALY